MTLKSCWKVLCGVVAVMGISLMTAQPAYADVGITPAVITNDHVKPGSKVVYEFVISHSDVKSDQKVTITTSMTGFDSWVSFDTGKEFMFPKSETRKTIKMTVNVPSDAQLGSYKGNIVFGANEVTSGATGSGNAIMKGVRADVNLTVTKQDFRDLKVKLLKLLEIKQGEDMVLEITAVNNGNVTDTASKVVFSVTDMQGKLVKEFEATTINSWAAGEDKVVTVKVANDLSVGNYFVNVKVYQDGKVLREDKLSLDVKPNDKKAEPTKASTDTKKETESSDTATIKLFITVSLVALVLVALAMIFKKVSEMKDLDENKKMLYYGLPVVVALGITALVIYLVYGGVIKFDEAKDAKKDDKVSQNVDNTVTTPTATATVQPTAKPEVQGVSTYNNPNSSSAVVTNNATTSDGKYKIYASPDFNSKVVYTASEGESMKATEKLDGWYKVTLSNGSVGYLPSSSVKSTK